MPVYRCKKNGTTIKGKYRVAVMVRGVRKFWIVDGTREDAEAFEAQKRLELKMSANALRAVPKFGAFAQGPYLSHAALHLKTGTLRNRKYTIEELSLAMGDLSLDEITPAVAEGYVGARLRAGKRPSTVNTELRALKRILSFARERGIPVAPPVFRPLPERGNEKRATAWTAEEVRRLYDACADVSPKILPIVVFLANTGCRKGEALALTWERVDLDGGVIWIEPSEEWQPKSGEPRQVPINDVLARWLERLPMASRYVFPCPGRSAPRKGLRALHLEATTAGRYVFWPLRAFDRAREAAGLKGGPHTLRHTYATMFLESGGRIEKLAEILGHSDARVTRVYRHLLPGHLEQDRNRVQFDPEIGVAEAEARKRWRK